MGRSPSDIRCNLSESAEVSSTSVAEEVKPCLGKVTAVEWTLLDEVAADLDAWGGLGNTELLNLPSKVCV